MKKISFLMLALSLMLVFGACKNEKTKSSTEEVKVEQESVQETTAKALEGDIYTMEPGALIQWNATKLTGKHNGTVAISEGKLGMEGGKITGGSFTIDMASIVVLDLEGEWKDKLEAHLKGTEEGKEDHFFNVAEHPTASFNITKVSDLEGNENANIMVYGDLEIKGISNAIGFTASMEQEGDNVSVTSNPIVVNRTDWGVNYNSKSVFPNLQDNIINDEFTLQISFKATKG